MWLRGLGGYYLLPCCHRHHRLRTLYIGQTRIWHIFSCQYFSHPKRDVLVIKNRTERVTHLWNKWNTSINYSLRHSQKFLFSLLALSFYLCHRRCAFLVNAVLDGMTHRTAVGHITDHIVQNPLKCIVENSQENVFLSRSSFFEMMCLICQVSFCQGHITWNCLTFVFLGTIRDAVIPATLPHVWTVFILLPLVLCLWGQGMGFQDLAAKNVS